MNYTINPQNITYYLASGENLTLPRGTLHRVAGESVLFPRLPSATWDAWMLDPIYTYIALTLIIVALILFVYVTLFVGRSKASATCKVEMSKKRVFAPYLLIAAAGLADVVTSVAGWSLGYKEVYVSGGSFLWIFYWLALTYAVMHVKSVSSKVKVWLPYVSGALLFTVPVLNAVTLFNSFC